MPIRSQSAHCCPQHPHRPHVESPQLYPGHAQHRSSHARWLVSRDAPRKVSRLRMGGLEVGPGARRSTAVYAHALASPLATWTSLALCSVCAQGLQTMQAGRALGAPLVAMLLGLMASSAGLLPVQHPVYADVWQSLMPMAAALFLLEADLRELLSSARTTTVAFCLASVATLIGTAVAWALLGPKLGPEGWKLVAALTASYIGGSINFAAVSATLGLAASGGPLVVATMAADNIAMAGYLAVISLCPVPEVRAQSAALLGDEDSTGQATAITTQSIVFSLAAAAVACWAGESAAGWLQFQGCSLGITALCASAIAYCASGTAGAREGARHNYFAGAEALGAAFMLYFFVTIGAAAGSLSALAGCGWIALFIAVQLSTHLIITLGVGHLTSLPLQALLTASNAAIGGPGTAAAMASSRGWTSQVTPAMLVGTLGYAVGTPLGLGVGFILKQLSA